MPHGDDDIYIGLLFQSSTVTLTASEYLAQIEQTLHDSMLSSTFQLLEMKCRHSEITSCFTVSMVVR